MTRRSILPSLVIACCVAPSCRTSVGKVTRVTPPVVRAPAPAGSVRVDVAEGVKLGRLSLSPDGCGTGSSAAIDSGPVVLATVEAAAATRFAEVTTDASAKTEYVLQIAGAHQKVTGELRRSALRKALGGDVAEAHAGYDLVLDVALDRDGKHRGRWKVHGTGENAEWINCSDFGPLLAGAVSVAVDQVAQELAEKLQEPGAAHP